MAQKTRRTLTGVGEPDYGGLLSRIGLLLEQGRRSAARTVNAILAATYWEVGRQFVEFEQGGQARAEYGEVLLKRLGRDLAVTYGRGFGRRNLFSMRNFYLNWEIRPTASGRLQARVKCPSALEGPPEKLQTLSAKLQPVMVPGIPINPPGSFVDAFPLPWSHYVRLMSVRDDFAR